MSFLYLLEKLRNPVLDSVFLAITTLGEEIIFIVLAIVLLWCVDKFEGYYMLSVGFVGVQLNQLLKVTFRIERPWVRDPSFTPVEGAVEEATGYSFPSGHTQSAVGSFGAVARWSKNNILRILCVLAAVLVAFSRMYLGVHTPADVLVSFILGTVLVLGFAPIFKRVKENPKIMYIFLSVMIVWSVAQVLFMELYPFPSEALGDELYSGLKNAYKMLGAVVGMAVVYHLDRKYIHFETKAVWWAQILKVVFGLILTLGIKELCYSVFGVIPYEPISRCLSYLIMVVFAGACWPLTFNFFAKLGVKKFDNKC